MFPICSEFDYALELTCLAWLHCPAPAERAEAGRSNPKQGVGNELYLSNAEKFRPTAGDDLDEPNWFSAFRGWVSCDSVSLGVLRDLRDAHLLQQISHMTSVSGGSIMACGTWCSTGSAIRDRTRTSNRHQESYSISFAWTCEIASCDGFLLLLQPKVCDGYLGRVGPDG